MADGFLKKEIPRIFSADGKSAGATQPRRTPRRIYTRPIGLLRAGSYKVFQALQLSEGGLLFALEKKSGAGSAAFNIADQVVVTLILPSGGGVVARGEVIYEKPGPGGERQFGIKFAPLSLQVRRAIRNYVTAKTQAEAEQETGDFEIPGGRH